MQRAAATILACALLGTLLGTLASSQTCSLHPGCKDGLCPFTAHHQNKSSDESTLCHHGESTLPECAVKSGCNHTTDSGVIAPLPPAILAQALDAERPQLARVKLFPYSTPVLSGFDPLPFQPPKS